MLIVLRVGKECSLVSRGATTLEIFLEGVSTVEAVMGESHDFNRRMGEAVSFGIVD